jgi:hypothetical protein
MHIYEIHLVDTSPLYVFELVFILLYAVVYTLISV